MEELLTLWKERINSGIGSRKDLIEALNKTHGANSCQLLIHCLEQQDGRF